MSICLAIADTDWSTTKDVASVIGTVISGLGFGLAFYVGLTGLSTWKRQLRGQADHALARRLLIAFDGYKKASLNLLLDSSFCVGNSEFQNDDYERIIRAEEGISSRIGIFSEECRQLQDTLLEVRLIWGPEFDLHVAEMLDLTSDACRYNKLFLDFLSLSGNPDVQGVFEFAVDSFEARLLELGAGNQQSSLSYIVQQMTVDANDYIKKKLTA